MAETFTQFKARFYTRIPDLAIFNCQEFNILKVVLDGLKVDYGRGRKKLLFKFLLPDLMWAVLKTFRINKPPVKETTGRKYLLIDNGGLSDSNGKPRLTFYDKIIQVLGRDKCFVFFNAPAGTSYYKEVREKRQEYLFDLIAVDARRNYSIWPSTNGQAALAKALKHTYRRICNARIFSNAELYNIRYAIDKFLDEFIICESILPPKFEKAFITCHYHQEALICYLRKHGVPIIELQHGLIARSDIFYVFPTEVLAIRNKMLMADEIWTYGEYWRKILSEGNEYQRNAVKVVGDFRAGSISSGREELRADLTDKIILVTTQTKTHAYFIDFVKDAVLNHRVSERFSIVVKIHPSESLESYSELENLHKVWITKHALLDELFKKAALHVSIYSTTFFDALKYGVRNLSIQLPAFFDYTRDIITDGIALPINPGDNPLMYLDAPVDAGIGNSDYYFEAFSPERITDEIR